MPRTRLPESERRQALVSVASDLARERGLALVTGRDIAANAGVSVGLIQYHFGSVDNLVATMFTQVQTEDLAAATEVVATSGSPQKALEALIDYFTPAPGNWRYRLWIDAWSLAPRQPLLRAAARDINLGWRDLILTVIKNGKRSGDFRVADPKATAWRVLSLLDALHIQVSAEQVDATPAQVRSWVRRGIALEVGSDLRSRA